MRAYHLYVDTWTVIDDATGFEYSVTAADREGNRKVTSAKTRRIPNTYVIQKVLAAVEQRRQQLGNVDDWRQAHTNYR